MAELADAQDLGTVTPFSVFRAFMRFSFSLRMFHTRHTNPYGPWNVDKGSVFVTGSLCGALAKRPLIPNPYKELA